MTFPRLWTAGLVALAAVVGLVAGVEPKLAVPAVLALCFVAIALADLTKGLALFVVISFLDVLPSSPTLSLPKAFGVLLLLSWLARVTVGRGASKSLLGAHPALCAALVAFCAWALMSVGWAESPGAAAQSVTRYAPNALLFVIVYAAIRERSDLRLVLGAFVVGAVAATAYGFAAPGSPATTGRLSGAVGDPNELAAALVAAACLAGGLWRVSRRGSPARVILVGAAAICVAGIFLSLSRGGLVALVVAWLAAVSFGGRWRPALAAVGLVAVLAGVGYFFALAPSAARDRVTMENGGTGRVDIYTVGWRMFEAHPVLGIGSGNFQISSVHYLLRPGPIMHSEFILDTPKEAHNIYLQLLAELGIPGLALLLVILVGSLRTVVQATRRFAAAGDVGMEFVSRAIFAALVGVLVADFFIPEQYSKQLWFLLALGPALLAVARHANPQEGDASSARQPPTPRSVSALEPVR